jgi:hypothetical protein
VVEDEGELLLRGSAPDDACTGTLTTKRHDASPLTRKFLVTSALAIVPGGDDACLGPQAALMVSGTCLERAPILRTRFLLSQRDIRLDGQGGAMPDVKLKARRLHDTSHPLACHLSANVVLPVIDAYASIGLHGAGKDPHERAVRINLCWLLGASVGKIGRLPELVQG